MGVDNLQWRKAKRVAGNAFIGFDSGWPERMDALQLARLQRPQNLEPVSADFGHKAFFIGYFPHRAHPDNQAHRELLAFLNTEFEAGNGPDTPHLFAAWLLAQRETPSIHIQAWFDAVGVVEPSATIAAPRPNELLSERNLRWLEYYEREVATGGKRGAYNRAAAAFDEKSSTFRKAVDKARNGRAECYRSDIKAVPRKDVARPFDGLITAVKDGKKVNPK